MLKQIFFIAVMLLFVFIIALIGVGLCIGIANMMIFFIPTITLVTVLVPSAILAAVIMIIFGGIIKNAMLNDSYEDEDQIESSPVIRIYPNRSNRKRR
jgi:phosphate/sulfate permease